MVDRKREFEEAMRSKNYLAAVKALALLRVEGAEVTFTFTPPSDATLVNLSYQRSNTSASASTDSSPMSSIRSPLSAGVPSSARDNRQGNFSADSSPLNSVRSSFPSQSQAVQGRRSIDPK